MSASVMFITVRLARPDHLRGAKMETGLTGIAVREDAMLRRGEQVERDWLLPRLRCRYAETQGFADRRILCHPKGARDLAVGLPLIAEAGEGGDRLVGPEIGGQPNLRVR